MLAVVNWVEGFKQMKPPALRGLCLTLCPLVTVSMSPRLGAALSDLTWVNVTVSGVAAKWLTALQMPGRGYREGDSTNDVTAQPRFGRVGTGQVALATKVSCCSFYTERCQMGPQCAMHLPKHCSLQCRGLRFAPGLLVPGSPSAHGKKWALLVYGGCLKMGAFVPQRFPGLCCHCVGCLALGEQG